MSKMNDGFNELDRRTIGDPCLSLISDREWQAIVDLYLGPEQIQQWYSEGFRDHQNDPLRDASAVMTDLAADMPEDEAPHVMTGLAYILAISHKMDLKIQRPPT